MSEERLSNLSLISIEQEQARKLELDELINDFAKKKYEAPITFFKILNQVTSLNMHLMLSQVLLLLVHNNQLKVG
ncbi:hypothetical protein O3M35_000626 [Rhynocoris fuscipes]|uniref:Uncharacterized protein n=1 Tax=Rhynocoris fuscipes TaxID=488301 RepID=A0AAW1DME5_9HEMI